ncbi:MAG: hypothetical protein ABIJ61_05830, partial [bacterium]
KTGSLDIMKKVADLILVLVLALAPALTLAAVDSPYAVAAHLREDGLLISWHYPGINRTALFHDHNEADDIFLVSEEIGDNRAAVVFSNIPDGGVCETMSIFLWGEDRFPEEEGGPTSPFGLDIFAECPDRTTEPLWTVVTNADSVPEAGGWIDIPVRAAIPVVDSAWLQFRWLRLTPTAPLLAVDFQAGPATHSYFTRVDGDEIEWSPNYDGEFLIRAAFTRTDTLLGVDYPEALPDSFTIYFTRCDSALAEPDLHESTIADSLHCLLDPQKYGGCSVSITAWRADLESEPTALLELSAPEILPSPLQLQTTSLHRMMQPNRELAATLELVNGWIDSIACSAKVSAGSWLAVDTNEIPLAPEESGHLDLLLSSHDMMVGTYSSEIVLTCHAAGVIFEDAVISVTLEVEQVTNVDGQSLPELSERSLEQNFPNPFNATTTIYSALDLPVAVYDILGRPVATLEPSGMAGSGPYRFQWNTLTNGGQEAPSGIYFYRQVSGASAHKMLLLR